MASPHEESLRVHAAGVAGRRAWTAWEGVSLEETGGMLTLSSSTPHSRFNAVLRTEQDQTPIAERIQQVSASADERRVPVAWWVDRDVSEATADDLPASLTSAGYAKGTTLSAMWADTDVMDDRIKTVRAFSCTRVATDAELEEWARIASVAYRFDDRVTADWTALHKAVGYAGDLGWRHYLARSGDDLVGCASAFVENDNVSISHVTTLPDYRGASVGTAASLAAIREVKAAQNIRHATLYAPERVATLYQRIGFHPAGTLDVYERQVS